MTEHATCLPSHKTSITATAITKAQEQEAIRHHQTASRVIPTDWNALGSPSWAPTLGGTLPLPDIQLEGLHGQLASHRQEDAKTQLLTAVTSHCMCYLMTHLHILLDSGMGFGKTLCMSMQGYIACTGVDMQGLHDKWGGLPMTTHSRGAQPTDRYQKCC